MFYGEKFTESVKAFIDELKSMLIITTSEKEFL